MREPLATEVEWSDFYSRWAREWSQGEHSTLIGPTNSGKTTLARALLRVRRTAVVIATKPRDDILSDFQEYRTVRTLPLPPFEVHPKVIFWPRSEKLSDLPGQRDAIRSVLANVYRQGGDCVYIDETYHLSESMRLEPLLNLLWRMGRTQGITVVASAQRPAHIPLVAYSQARHLFFFRQMDQVDVRRVAGFAGQDRWKMARALHDLPAHSFAHIDTFSGEITVSRVDLREPV